MKHLTASCDHCGKTQGARLEVLEVQMRTSDKQRYEVDLCAKCWQSMISDYQIRQYKPRNRNAFTVIDLDSIPSDT